MGTLTAHQVRLPENCEHKLPTSCRLTSIPNCCACADERAHAPSYSTYIDGIGFVPRGNRWQRYCWYCKEFWENRVRVSGLLPAQTRIPEEPDQSEFLKRWYEFHRGYRIVSTTDGTEERIAVLGEDFKDVSPGCLPRTVEEMRAGQRADEVRGAVIRSPTHAHQEDGPTLDEALDQMFADAEHEQQSMVASPSTTTRITSPRPVDVPSASNIHAQAMDPAPSRNREQQFRRVAALRRELIRMRGGIERVVSGLRDLGERIPDQDSLDTMRRLDSFIETAAAADSRVDDSGANTPPLNSLSTTASTASGNPTLLNLQQRIDVARERFNVAAQARTQAASELENADIEYRTASQQLQQLQREQRTVENYTRVFGTREEMVAQGENWESPIGGMFSRAYERFRAAEDVRREQRTLRQVLEDEERIDTDEAVSRRLEELETRERDVWGVPRAIPIEQLQNVPMSTEDPNEPIVASLDAVSVRRASVEGVGTTTASQQSADRDETLEPDPFIYRVDEAVLQEYFSHFEDPNWDLRPLIEPPSQRILNAYWARRARDRAARSHQPTLAEEPVPSFSQEEWWQEDAEIIVRSLTTNSSLREAVDFTAADAAVLLAYFIDGIVSEADLSTIDSLMQNPLVIWATGLPIQWVTRQTELLRAKAINGMFFTGAGNPDWAEHHNPYIKIELAAQAFMMSAEIRRLTTMLSPPERLQMLYRLQSGRRTAEDVARLENLSRFDVGDPTCEIWQRILVVYYRHHFGNDDAEVEQANLARIQRARDGEHSRRGLDARRRATANHMLAIAAGRQAMQTGSQALMEQMAVANRENTDDNAEAGTRAAFHRLHVNGFDTPDARERTERRTTLYRQLTLDDYMTSSPGSSRSSSPESGRGLDANDSGRPEPKSEEEMQVSMECKVCYTQMADIACLPCGHLVMCKWCSDQHSPCLAHDRTRPRRPATCPVCRKGIKQKVRVFRA